MIKKIQLLDILSLFVLFIPAIFLLFFGLGDTYLTNWDEAWYADISRNMMETGDIITTIWNMDVFFEKPPLYFWLTSLFFSLFGVSEFSARLPSAIFGLAIAAVVYFFTKNLFNKNSAIVATLILFSSPQFLYRARTGNLDTVLTFWMFLSFYAFYKGYTASKKWFFLTGISLALAFLTKGVVGFYPLIPIFVFLILGKEFKVMKEQTFIMGVGAGFVLSSLWLLSSLLLNGQVFLNQFLTSNTEKFGFGLKSFINFSLDYFIFLKAGLKIWFLFLALSIGYSLYRIKNKNLILPLLYFILFVVIMSFVDNKSNWFILPIYPVAAILIAGFFYSLSNQFLSRKFNGLLISLILLVASIQNIIYNKEYFVEDIAGDEARVAIFAKDATKKKDTIYLTNYYFPTTVFYSQRKVLAVYSERNDNGAWWIRPKTEWKEILEKDMVTIITTIEEFKELKDAFPEKHFEVLFQSGSKLLVRKNSI